ncbi:hypothetical protein ACFE04_018836 [Oxalis oulophora]
MEEASEAHKFYGSNPTDSSGLRKRNNHGWNMNEWKWDGDLFLANQLNSVPTDTDTDTDRISKQFFPLEPGNSSNSSPSCSDEVGLTNGKGKSEPEKKRRVIVVDHDDGNNVTVGSGDLTLNLTGNGYQVSEREAENAGKKTKLVGGSSSRATCHVDNCGSDLSKAKDYHRRHKVCEMHSKATSALVGNLMQRFCQQCSRFHVLEEFDEGKRSCRRRLAGHNKRRRKAIPEPVSNGNTVNDDQTTANRSDQPTDKDLLSHILNSLATPGGANNGSSVTKSDIISALLTNVQDAPRSFKQHLAGHTSPTPQHGGHDQNAQLLEIQDRSAGKTKMNDFDLNDIYIDSEDGTDVPMNMGANSVDCPSWVQPLDSNQSSPPQTSRNSDSASGQSPSSSSGDTQSRTDRIKLKLFIQDPNEFPIGVRAQILDWLSHYPTDMESYIRPGCVILTIYLRQSVEAWEELCCDLSSSLSKLFQFSNDTFWTTGWVYVRVQDQIAFIHNGQVLVDTSFPLRSDNYSRILSVRPIAISASQRAEFLVRGTNLLQPTTRLLCAVEGKYLEQYITDELVDGVDSSKEDQELQYVHFSCSVPIVNGRGFIEVEDNEFSNSSFPFIVAEEDVCSEIRVLESVIETTDVGETKNSEAKNQALDFIHEIGWLLHRTQLKTRLSHLNPDPFPLSRFKWIIDFSLDHEWCAVVNKLLSIFLEGTVDTGEYSSWSVVLSEMGLLHRAVRKNSQRMVEFLLGYVPEKVSDKFETEQRAVGDKYLFKPDVAGPGGLTPLHIAAGKDGSETILNALTNDPGMVGIEAWKTARDSTGFTPEDYARLRGHYSYIHLVQKKINQRHATGHVVINIPGAVSDCTVNWKQNKLAAGFEIGQATSVRKQCKRCDQKLAYGRANRSLVYRPAMLSLVTVAAVCVCVALLFKSCPEVLYVFRPFRWEMLKYGTS